MRNGDTRIPRKGILLGICGIGHGHSYRQLPIAEHFAKTANLVLFCYGESLSLYRQKFAHHPNVRVIKVAVPFYVFTPEGIDEPATAAHPRNQKNFASINQKAMQQADAFLGKPDLVITDYEPIAAEYGHKHGAPVVTLDQQSKYLYANAPAELNGQTQTGETQLLKHFFPHVKERIACSFFKVEAKQNAIPVTICPPILRPSISGAKPAKLAKPYLLIYTSSQQATAQPLEDILAICAQSAMDFHLVSTEKPANLPANIHHQPRGSSGFENLLINASGIIATAGHTLLSEAMHLAIPVLAMPLPVYEQQMNAHVIHTHGFGLATPTLTPEILTAFLQNIPTYQANIANDTTILHRESGLATVLKHLAKYLSK